MSAKDRSGHAIVLGSSIAGLLAARVLSESFAKVTIFDRDELPSGNQHRRGVPQGEHSHGLLALGRKVLEELFDDFIPEITALGGLPIDLGKDTVWYGDGQQLPRTENGLLGLCVSRPTLEFYVRSRVSQLPNVEFRDRTEALGLLTDAKRTRVTGARVLPRNGDEEEISADLVIDATGRGNRGPTWLSQIGYAKPAEEHVDAVTAYVSRDYRRVSGDADFRALIQSPWPGNPFGGVCIAADGDRWMVTLLGCGTENFPPADPEAFLEFARDRLPTSDLYDLLSKSEPVGPPMKMRLPVSVRRRYEKMSELPEGFVAIGDSICAFNPAYGQGMTVAAAEAMELRDALAKGRKGLPKRFYAAAAKIIDVPWDMAVGGDLRFDHVKGFRSGKTKMLNGYVAKIFAAAPHHPMVAKAFLSVANLMAPPQSLFAPGVARRVLFGRKAAPVSVTQPSATPARELEPVA